MKVHKSVTEEAKKWQSEGTVRFSAFICYDASLPSVPKQSGYTAEKRNLAKAWKKNFSFSIELAVAVRLANFVLRKTALSQNWIQNLGDRMLFLSQRKKVLPQGLCFWVLEFLVLELHKILIRNFCLKPTRLSYHRHNLATVPLFFFRDWQRLGVQTIRN